MKDFSSFEADNDLNFSDKNLLKQAFTHRSYLNEHPGLRLRHNERLEFLGDAVLQLVATEYLYERFPETPEGELTAYRASLVNTASLSGMARRISMNDYLLLSRGEAKDTGKARDYILANTFEALIGAIYLDKGYASAREFIAARLFPELDIILEKHLWQDAKSKFQEKAQDAVGVTPSYDVLDETGPDHAKEFTIGVFLGTERVATGKGRSKQEAEQEAAKNAIEKKRWS